MCPDECEAASGLRYTLQHRVLLSMSVSGWFCIVDGECAGAAAAAAQNEEAARLSSASLPTTPVAVRRAEYYDALLKQLLHVSATAQQCDTNVTETVLTPAGRALLLRWSTHAAAGEGLCAAAWRGRLRACSTTRWAHLSPEGDRLPAVEDYCVDGGVCGADAVSAMLHPLGSLSVRVPCTARHDDAGQSTALCYEVVYLLLSTLSFSPHHPCRSNTWMKDEGDGNVGDDEVCHVCGLHDASETCAVSPPTDAVRCRATKTRDFVDTLLQRLTPAAFVMSETDSPTTCADDEAEESVLLWLQCAVLAILLRGKCVPAAAASAGETTGKGVIHGLTWRRRRRYWLPALCAWVNARRGVDAVYLLTRFLLCGEGGAWLVGLMCPGGPAGNWPQKDVPTFARLACPNDDEAMRESVADSDGEAGVAAVWRRAFVLTEWEACGAAELRALLRDCLCHNEAATWWTAMRTRHRARCEDAEQRDECMPHRPDKSTDSPSDRECTVVGSRDERDAGNMCVVEEGVVDMLRQQRVAEWRRYADAAARVRELSRRLCQHRRTRAQLRGGQLDVVYVCSLCVHRWLDARHAPASWAAAVMLFARVGYDAWMSEVTHQLVRFIDARYRAVHKEKVYGKSAEDEAADALPTTTLLLVAMLAEPFVLRLESAKEDSDAAATHAATETAESTNVCDA